MKGSASASEINAMRSIARRTFVATVLLFAGVVQLTPADQRAGPPEPPDSRAEADRGAPWKRVLTGTDASRVGELEGKLAQAEQAGRFAEAAEAARQIASIRTGVQGADHWQAADARRKAETLRLISTQSDQNQKEMLRAAKLDAEAHQLWLSQGRHAEAGALIEQVLAIRRKVLGEEHAAIATNYNDLASLLDVQGKTLEAEALHRKALRVWRKTLGDEHPDTARGYNSLACNLRGQRQFAEAETLHRSALAIWRRLRGEEHIDTDYGHSQVAHTLFLQGKYVEAEPLYRQALAIRLKTRGENHADTALAYSNLASAVQNQGKFAKAEPLYRQALTIRCKVQGEEHPATAFDFHQLAYNLNAQAKYAEAEPLCQKELAICRKVLGEEHPDTGRAYRGLAYVLYGQAKYALAEPLHRRALAIWREALGEEHVDTATGFHYLADTLDALGKNAEAEPLHRKAMAIYRKALGEEHPDTVSLEHYLAINLDRQGKYAEGESLFRKTLASWSRVQSEWHPNTSMGYGNLGNNLDAQGKYDAAELLYRKALAIEREVLGEEHPVTTSAYNNLAGNLMAQGKYPQAEAMLVKAVNGYQVQRFRIAFSGLERAASWAKESPFLRLAALRAREGHRADAWQQLEADLARGLLDDLSSRQARKLTAEEARRGQELLRNINHLTGQIIALSSAKQLADPQRRKLNDLGQQRNALQAEFGQFQLELVKKYGAAAGQPHDLPRIQKHLPVDAALVAWLDLKGEAKAVNPSGEHWACIVRRQGLPVWVKLPGGGPHGTWVESDYQLPDHVRQAFATQPAAPSAAWQETAGRLSAQRLAPLETHFQAGADLPAVKHLIVLPSELMAGIPIETLSDKYKVSYAPSGTVYAWLQEQRQRTQAVRHDEVPRLLALGDPVFKVLREQAAAPPPDHGELITQVAPASLAARSGLESGDVLLEYGPTRLAGPGTLAQALERGGSGQHRTSVKVWRKGETLVLTVGPGKLEIVLSKKPAGEAIQAQREADKLIQTSRGKAYLPLPGSRSEVEAIAALFDRAVKLLGSDASQQRLEELTATGELGGFQFLHFATHGEVNPRVALHSALVLANDRLPDPVAQALAGKAVQDGRLTAERMLHTWKLDADLVTLSACQTGLGTYAGGEGYLGFAQALFLAGARSVVVSLWHVDDRATGLLMIRFYQNLLGKRAGLRQPLPKAQALAEAKTWLRQLSAEEIRALVKQLPSRGRSQPEDEPERPPGQPVRSFQHPYYWAGFILIGDPN
jgi:hypothetical protein